MTLQANKFRKKPAEVAAVQWGGSVAQASEIIDWVLRNDGTATYECDDRDRCASAAEPGSHYIAVRTPDSTGRVRSGDWLIRGPAGDHYPCRADIFTATYEPA